MICRAPAGALDPLIVGWPAGQEIHVIHDTAFPAHSFNPGIDAAGVLRKPTRFAPIADASGSVVPYLYGGSTLECAIFETVLHDVPIAAADKYVDLGAFARRGHGILIANRALLLVDLTTDGLHRLGVPKEELIASPSRAYVQTARWAEALHRQCKDVDGLLWMSKQRDRDHALLLFGDRVDGVLSGERLGGALATNTRLREAILAVALRSGIAAH